MQSIARRIVHIGCNVLCEEVSSKDEDAGPHADQSRCVRAGEVEGLRAGDNVDCRRALRLPVEA